MYGRGLRKQEDDVLEESSDVARVKVIVFCVSSVSACGSYLSDVGH